MSRFEIKGENYIVNRKPNEAKSDKAKGWLNALKERGTEQEKVVVVVVGGREREGGGGGAVWRN